MHLSVLKSDQQFHFFHCFFLELHLLSCLATIFKYTEKEKYVEFNRIT